MQKYKLVLGAILAATLFATDLNYTWANTEWNTPWTAVADYGACDTQNDFDYQTTGGNPDYFRRRWCVGRNDNNILMHAEWTGTWETLGVPSGNTVSTIQMTDVDTKMITWNVCDATDMGPFELRDSSDTLVATLWSGRSPTAAEGSWTSEGSQSAQSVGSLTASSSSIELWFRSLTNTGNNSSAECTFGIDNLDITVVHTSPPSTTVNKLLITFDGQGRIVRRHHVQ